MFKGMPMKKILFFALIGLAGEVFAVTPIRTVQISTASIPQQQGLMSVEKSSVAVSLAGVITSTKSFTANAGTTVTINGLMDAPASSTWTVASSSISLGNAGSTTTVYGRTNLTTVSATTLSATTMSASSESVTIFAANVATVTVMYTNKISTQSGSGGVGIRGTGTNDSAVAGDYGEYISSATSSDKSFPGTGTYGDLLSMTLTAGDWDITAQAYGNANGATVVQMSCGISTTTGNSSVGLIPGDTQGYYGPVPSATASGACVVANVRKLLTAATVIYMKMNASFSVATPTSGARFSARRMR